MFDIEDKDEDFKDKDIKIRFQMKMQNNIFIRP